LLAALALLGPVELRSQWVCIRKDGKACTAHDVDEMVCKPEPAPANLSVAHQVRLTGTLLDPTGSPIDFDAVVPDHHTIVQIRDVNSGQVLFAVPLRANGGFEFEFVPAGEYRLIAVWMKDGRLRRLPLADQPKEIRCSDTKECRISAVITFHGTDNPIDSCPPK
jgi:hypothetical protein